MPFEQHQEKKYPKDAQSIFQAALKATEKLEGKIISSAPEKFSLTARFPKTILGQTVGARKGVTLTVVTWFIAHLEHNLGIPSAQ